MGGYFGKSKSNNALAAEQNKKYPAYKAAKLLKVTTKCIYEILSPCEWHHTSPCFNETNYYYIGIMLRFQDGLSTDDLINLGYDENEVLYNYLCFKLLKQKNKFKS